MMMCRHIHMWTAASRMHARPLGDSPPAPAFAPLQPRRTILYFPKGLQHVYGNQMAWAYMGGFLV